MAARWPALALCVTLLGGAVPAWAGWQEEYKAGLEDISAGRYGLGVDKACVAVLGQNDVPTRERAQAIVLLVDLLFKADLDDEAERLLTRAMADDDENRDAYFFCRGMLHERAWRFERAVADYQAALGLNPANAGALLGLGRLRLKCPEDAMRDRTQALELARRAQKAADNAGGRAMGHMLEAQAQAQAQCYDQAVAAQQAAVAAAEAGLSPEQVQRMKAYLAELRRMAAADERAD